MSQVVGELENTSVAYNNGSIVYERDGWLCTLQLYTTPIEERRFLTKSLGKVLNRGELGSLRVAHYSCNIVTIYAAGLHVLISVNLETPELSIANTVYLRTEISRMFVQNTPDTIFCGQFIADSWIITRFDFGKDPQTLSPICDGSENSWQILVNGFLYLFVDCIATIKCRQICLESGREIDRFLPPLPDNSRVYNIFLYSENIVALGAQRRVPTCITASPYECYTRKISDTTIIPWKRVRRMADYICAYPSFSIPFAMFLGVSGERDFVTNTPSGTRKHQLESHFSGSFTHDERSFVYSNKQGIFVVSFDPCIFGRPASANVGSSFCSFSLSGFFRTLAWFSKEKKNLL
jgi:hypothetical protein